MLQTLKHSLTLECCPQYMDIKGYNKLSEETKIQFENFKLKYTNIQKIIFFNI